MDNPFNYKPVKDPSKPNYKKDRKEVAKGNLVGFLLVAAIIGAMFLSTTIIQFIFGN